MDPLAGGGDPYIPQKKSAFLSFLDWLDRPGQVVRNALTGNFEGALRQGGDFLGDALDAFLPGDLIPQISRPEDYVSGSDLVDKLGAGEDQPGWLKTAEDVGVGMLTDPLTYISFGELPAAAKAARLAAVAGKEGPEAIAAARGAAEASSKGVRFGIPFTNVSTPVMAADHELDPLALVGQGLGKASTYLPQQAQDALAAVGRFGRSVTGNLRRTLPLTEHLVNEGRAVGQGSQAAGQEAIQQIFQGSDEAARHAMFQAVNDYTGEAGARQAIGAGQQPINAAYTTGAIRDPLADVPFSGAAEPVTPEESMLQVRGKLDEDGNPIGDYVRGKIKPLHSDVGIEGVDVPGIHEGNLDSLVRDPVGMGDQVFNPKYADRAADRTLEQAYPPEYRDPRFTSGIDEANRAYGLGGRRRTFGPDDPLAPAVDLAVPPNPLDAKRVLDDMPTDLARKPSALEQMLGAPVVKPEVPAPAEMGSVTDALNERMGGAAAPRDSVPIADLPNPEASFDTIENQLGRIKSRLDAMDLPPDVREKAMAMYEKFAPYAAEQWRNEVKAGVMTAPLGVDIERYAPKDYIQRRFAGLATNEDQALTGGANATKERVLKGGESVADFLNKNPNVSLEEDAAKAAAYRNNQHAQVRQSSVVGGGLIEDYAKRGKSKLTAMAGDTTEQLAPAALTDAEKAAVAAQGTAMNTPEYRSAVDKIIGEIRTNHPEDAEVLRDAFSGLPPRGPITGALARMNRYFKPAATMGILLPRMAFITRNAINGQWQILANAEAAGHVGKTMRQVIPNIMGAISDGIEHLFGARVGADTFAEYKAALKAGGGTREGVLANLKDPSLREAYAHGVLENNFVSAEQIADSLSNGNKWKQRATRWTEMPAKMAQGAEQRMRFGLFKALRDGGHSAADAAQVVRDTLFDYSHGSKLNRAARDWIPFFQWSGKAVPTQAKFLSRNPAAGVAISGLYAEHPKEPVTPWLEEQPRVNLGTNDRGNAEYLTGLGLAADTLSSVPNLTGAASLGDLGRDFERSVVASASPVVKAAYQAVSGRDPFYGADAYQHTTVPVFGDLGEAGRLYNYASSTGVTSPIDSALRQIDTLTNSKDTVGEKALEFLFGARVNEVDPDQARAAQIGSFLDRDPDVASSRNLYSLSHDPATQGLIREMNAAKKKAADKRKASAATAEHPGGV